MKQFGTEKIDLVKIATDEMIEKGFLTDYGPAIEEELSTLNQPAQPEDYRDLTDRLWFSIDNDTSLDLDQANYIEKLPDGSFKVYVAVADVDSLVKRDSPVDQHASHNTTSVYTPEKIFAMLPEKLSTNLTSLNEGQKRCAIVIESLIATDGSYEKGEIYPAYIVNHYKLTYPNVAAFIENGEPLNHSKVTKELEEQIQLHDQAAQAIKQYRIHAGALQFSSTELQIVFQQDEIKGVKDKEESRSQEIIENCMIVSNISMTRFLHEQQLPAVRRIVRSPEKWDKIMVVARDKGFKLPPEPDVKALQTFLSTQADKDPIGFPDLSLTLIKLIGRGEYVSEVPGDPAPGHFDLAVSDYAHTTAPNRRFPDLIMQRIIKSFFFKQPLPYTDAELEMLAAHCTERENAANKVERKLLKCAAALALSTQIGLVSKAIVTGASHKGTWVRLYKPHIEGKLVKGYKDLEVGDKITVQLVSTDPLNGYIDFARMP